MKWMTSPWTTTRSLLTLNEEKRRQRRTGFTSIGARSPTRAATSYCPTTVYFLSSLQTASPCSFTTGRKAITISKLSTKNTSAWKVLSRMKPCTELTTHVISKEQTNTCLESNSPASFRMLSTTSTSASQSTPTDKTRKRVSGSLCQNLQPRNLSTKHAHRNFPSGIKSLCWVGARTRNASLSRMRTSQSRE